MLQDFDLSAFMVCYAQIQTGTKMSREGKRYSEVNCMVMQLSIRISVGF